MASSTPNSLIRFERRLRTRNARRAGWTKRQSIRFIFVVYGNYFQTPYSSISCATWIQSCARCSISIASPARIWWRTKKKRTRYWLRTVRACLKAEEAYGPGVVYRLRYTALVENPESALRSLLDFVGEPYSAKCLEPLSKRINSSNVPPDFKSDDPATDPAIVEQARRLSAEIEQTSQPTEHSSAAADELEAEFGARVKHIATFGCRISQAE